MKVIQIIPNLGYGDAVGNDAVAIAKVIGELGYETGIYAKVIDKRIKAPFVRNISELPKLSDSDVVIFNQCTGSDLYKKFQKLKGRKMMIYHNITPPKFFEGYNRSIVETLNEGYRQTRELADTVEFCMADSEYNAADLREMGYKCPIFVRPILIPFEDYKKEPDKNVIEKYSGDGYTNILFVGRVAPNKKHEDIIAAYAYYKKYINPKSRLILVGSDGGLTKYGNALRHYADALGAEDIVFTGHTSFHAILAYYKIADVFLCMSEHEGFCVPLLESMFFEKPIIAFDSCAVPDTLGGSGVLIKEKDPVFVSLLIDRIMKDADLRQKIVESQNERLKQFSYENIRARFEEGLKLFIEQKY